MRPAHLLLLLALNCVWASLPAAVTVLKARLTGAELVTLRYGLALAALGLVWPWLPGRCPRGRDLARTALMGFLVFAVGHPLQVAGIRLGRAGDASIVLALDPLVTSLGAALFLHERIPGRRWAGFALGIAGVAVISLWGGHTGAAGLAGSALIVFSFISEAVWTVMGKPLVERWGIPKVVTVALAAGTAGNLLWLAPDAGAHWRAIANLDATGWWVAGMLGVVGTAVGYSLWYVVIREAPVSVAALTIYSQPVIGSALAVLWAGERLHLGHLWGSLIIAAGLCLGIREPRRGTVAR